MKNNFFFFLNILFYFLTPCVKAVSFEYVYPVALVDHSHLLVLHQSAIDDIQLWVWDIENNAARKELNSLYLPSSIQILPGGKAYSFIDRGRFKIKSFDKRTPKTLEFYEPIYAICCIKWITDNQCYFVAKYKGFFRIFLCDILEHTVTLSALHDFNQQLNFTYPCKIEDELFFILNDNDQYEICKLAWRAEKDLSNFQACNNQDCIFKSPNQLCFLSMQNEKNGFVLELLNENGAMVHFSCLQISISEESSWTTRRLFNFKLPKDLIFGFDQTRLYESIYPFLPQYFKSFLLFMDYDEISGSCQIFLFNYKTTQTLKVNTLPPVKKGTNPIHYFSPLILQGSIFYGSSNYCNTQEESLVTIDPRTGICRFQLPKLEMRHLLSEAFS